MYLITPALQTYDWGTTDDIPDLLGLEPTGQPVAEAWWGAHPAASALAWVGDTPTPLTDMIAADAGGMLGVDIAEQWEGLLPYLLKVLAIKKPLSIQVHPSLEQARQGFDREEGQGIALDARERTFKDPSHKPEMVIALTSMVILAGFREPAAVAEDLARVGGAQAAVLRETLIGDDEPAECIAAYVRAAVALPRDAEVLTALTTSAGAPEASDSHRVAAAALADHPGDVGALVALAMNTIYLEPGQANVTGAGVVHSYQSGVGLEIMANSDNVVRAGLTSKVINTDLLLEIADTTPGIPDAPHVRETGAMRTFVCSAREYALSLVTDGEASVPSGPRLVLCVEGEASLHAADQRLALRPGQAAFVPDSDGVLDVSASQLTVVASVASAAT